LSKLRNHKSAALPRTCASRVHKCSSFLDRVQSRQRLLRCPLPLALVVHALLNQLIAWFVQCVRCVRLQRRPHQSGGCLLYLLDCPKLPSVYAQCLCCQHRPSRLCKFFACTVALANKCAAFAVVPRNATCVFASYFKQAKQALVLPCWLAFVSNYLESAYSTHVLSPCCCCCYELLLRADGMLPARYQVAQQRQRVASSLNRASLPCPLHLVLLVTVL
jgi:hypothetical protein